jgi:ABC-type polysaccharide/polyol phosphate export permease
MGERLEKNVGPQVDVEVVDAPAMRWGGDYIFLIQHLVGKDFKVRYRNMSLGIFWSLLNPLVMMGVMWFVFTKVFPNNHIPHFALFVLSALVPYNFFTMAWACGATSLVDSALLIKRVPVPREIIPIASVLGTLVHILAQIALLLTLSAFTVGIHWSWLWLMVVWPCEIVFVCGLALLFSGLNVYIRDIRYVIESANVVLFWLVPIFYPFSIIAPQYREIYQYNPVAATVLASRSILLEGTAPPWTLTIKLICSSALVLTIGLLVFRRLKSAVYNYL